MNGISLSAETEAAAAGSGVRVDCQYYTDNTLYYSNSTFYYGIALITLNYSNLSFITVLH